MGLLPEVRVQFLRRQVALVPVVEPVLGTLCGVPGREDLRHRPPVRQRVSGRRHDGHELPDALQDLKSFPRIRLDDRSCIGKARLNILARYLT